MDAVRFDCNSAALDAVARHLAACDRLFVPPLSSRVNVDEYAAKLVQKAERLEAWVEDALIGLIAFYCDDTVGQQAYISNVSVEEPWQGRGIGLELLRRCIDSCARARMRTISLAVSAENRAALRLYESCGFSATDADGSTLRLTLVLGGQNNE